ncbi:response regulator [Gloeocapsa sp. PCC 73106]|uniref:response regulator n=1 Tax=Gloeocapsa sp. PCC 73106 TaxID=102232 RepID=UPI0002ACCA2A|nr:response regulator [Gloeocapsa sp. PCC 73106]ELR98116.1 response regulator containing a CheY-like receiver domain and an HTH DNA-binding domain [Gloeocapsa sp. PCC 73106]
MSEKLINVLLVEDDDVDRINVKRAFQRNNIRNPLYMAHNGLEALEMLRSHGEIQPVVPWERRLILLDLNMPKMNGLEFLQELRNDPLLMSTPVIILTTSDEDRDRVEAYQFNIAGYILKPVIFTKFADMIGTLNKYWTLCEMP